MREILLGACKSYYVGLINKHVANVEIYLSRSMGIGEHSDIMSSIDKEISEIGKYDDRLSMILKYFEKPKQKENSNEAKEKNSK